MYYFSSKINQQPDQPKTSLNDYWEESVTMTSPALQLAVKRWAQISPHVPKKPQIALANTKTLTLTLLSATALHNINSPSGPLLPNNRD